MTPETKAISRRAFLTGERGERRPADLQDQHCISSAVASLIPGREEEVLRRFAEMEGIEVRASQGTKYVLLLEGPSSGAVGSLLAQIAVMDGVISANMVFEHTESAGA